ncbi:hypothetical protein VNI00_014973 [Paramarasmius palmivorus]|uniref:Rhodopsin domain-containing protein n=1 Tax=Paramarasmius palmivorus TaxID=297713 RepID=A0AAW0BPV2_9AGAR
MVSMLAFRVIATLLHSLAIATTGYRLWHRHGIKRLSWDDACSFLACILAMGELTSLWLKVKIDNEVPANTPEYALKQSILFWFTTINFAFIVSLSRISLWLSLRRIMAPGSLRKWCIPMAVVTALTTIVVTSTKGSMCVTRPTGPNQGNPLYCSSPIPFITLQTVADVSLSLALVGVPMISLWNMDLPSRQRCFMISLFAASMFTLGIALFHNILVIMSKRLLNQFTNHFEAAIALLVCNIHVVATGLYSLRRHERYDDDIVHPSLRTLVASKFNSSTVDCPSESSSTITTKPHWSHDQARRATQTSSRTEQTELTFTDFSASLVQSTSVPTLTIDDKVSSDGHPVETAFNSSSNPIHSLINTSFVHCNILSFVCKIA